LGRRTVAVAAKRERIMMELDSIPSFLGPHSSEIDEFYSDAVGHFDNCAFAEIGVYYGRSVIFLGGEIKRQQKDIKVYAVDTWAGNADDPHDLLYRGEIDKDGGDIYDTFLKNLRDAGVDDVVVPIRKLSHEAATLFKDGEMSLVFLDGRHDLEGVRTDIDSWWPRVREGGWLSGHDFNWRWPDVVKGVGEFSESTDHHLNVRDNVWKVVKGDKRRSG
jgi:hypothetical protein